MSLKNYCIIIPTYKAIPDSLEKESLSKALRMLDKDFFIVCPKDMNTSEYELIALNNKRMVRFIYFDVSNFIGIRSYSKLLLDPEFYKRFLDYEYLLIYQLDCWVYRNDLSSFFEKKYDYVGAPVFCFGKKATPDAPILFSGNGGLSLRKTSTFFELSKKNFFFKYLLKLFWVDLINLFSSDIVKKETSKAVFKQLYYLFIGKDFNEDVVWCLLIGRIYNLNIAPTEIAKLFSVEMFPQSLDLKQKPFGLHAWKKYDTRKFFEP